MRLQHKTYAAEEIAEQMYQRLKSIDEESQAEAAPKDRTAYAKKFPLEKCRQIVEASLERARIISGQVTEENRQKLLSALGTLVRKKAKRVVYRLKAESLITLSTKERQAESCSAAELRRKDKTVFSGPGCDQTLRDEQLDFFREVQDPDGLFSGAAIAVDNAFDFKTPLNLVIADAGNERRFVRHLTEPKNSGMLDAWLKNAPQRFYSIEYAWKKGEHPKRGEFNPDFFIKTGNMVYVVEIKGDEELGEPSLENQKKNEYAQAHFDRLNKWLKKECVPTHYQFNFLTPKNYGAFFEKLRNNDLEGFRSDLDIALKKATST